jgi:hypothetical protein
MAEENGVTMYVTEDGKKIYITTDKDQLKVSNQQILFSFGAGDWLDGPDADETCQDTSSRWLALSAMMSTRVVLEKKNCTPIAEQLSGIMGKVVSLREVWLGLERIGETSAKFSHHEVTRQQPSNEVIIKSVQTLCFLFKDVKEPDSKTKPGKNNKDAGKGTKKQKKGGKRAKKEHDQEEDCALPCVFSAPIRLTPSLVRQHERTRQLSDRRRMIFREVVGTVASSR